MRRILARRRAARRFGKANKKLLATRRYRHAPAGVESGTNRRLGKGCTPKGRVGETKNQKTQTRMMSRVCPLAGAPSLPFPDSRVGGAFLEEFVQHRLELSHSPVGRKRYSWQAKKGVSKIHGALEGWH